MLKPPLHRPLFRWCLLRGNVLLFLLCPCDTDIPISIPVYRYRYRYTDIDIDGYRYRYRWILDYIIHHSARDSVGALPTAGDYYLGRGPFPHRPGGPVSQLPANKKYYTIHMWVCTGTVKVASHRIPWDVSASIINVYVSFSIGVVFGGGTIVVFASCPLQEYSAVKQRALQYCCYFYCDHEAANDVNSQQSPAASVHVEHILRAVPFSIYHTDCILLAFTFLCNFQITLLTNGWICWAGFGDPQDGAQRP